MNAQKDPEKQGAVAAKGRDTRKSGKFGVKDEPGFTGKGQE